MTSELYEIVVRGNAGVGVRAAFRDFDITVEEHCTRLQTELADQAALFGALDRMRGLGLELLEVRRIDRGRTGRVDAVTAPGTVISQRSSEGVE